jgi:hypothetical protein
MTNVGLLTVIHSPVEVAVEVRLHVVELLVTLQHHAVVVMGARLQDGLEHWLSS